MKKLSLIFLLSLPLSGAIPFEQLLIYYVGNQPHNVLKVAEVFQSGDEVYLAYQNVHIPAPFMSLDPVIDMISMRVPAMAVSPIPRENIGDFLRSKETPFRTLYSAYHNSPYGTFRLESYEPLTLEGDGWVSAFPGTVYLAHYPWIYVLGNKEWFFACQAPVLPAIPTGVGISGVGLMVTPYWFWNPAHEWIYTDSVLFPYCYSLKDEGWKLFENL